MARNVRLHGAYLALVCSFAIGSFLLGRYTARRADMVALREIANDPKMSEAAHAVAALDDFRKAMQTNAATLRQESEQSEAEDEAKKAAEIKRRESATAQLETADVRLTVVKVSRGKLNRQYFGVRRQEPEPLDHDCLLVGFKIQNVSKSSLLDVDFRKAFDNFGNELQVEQNADQSQIEKLLGVDRLNFNNLAPGESKLAYAVYKQPLPNASWYDIECHVLKADGTSSDIGLIKAANW